VVEEVDRRLRWSASVEDGQEVGAGQRVGTISGPARSILTSERLILNLVSRLAGIATLTREFVRRVEGTAARIYDTRKTTPGWRLLEKYAVRCGGGWNHRSGLYDAVLIKDNHLQVGRGVAGECFSPAEAVRRARAFVAENILSEAHAEMPVEIEVDTLEQLAEVLPEAPDIVLLDNMTPAELAQAVALRNASAASVLLEASGGVTLETVRAIADSGVDRISAGSLTHSARWLDIGLDWWDAADPA
jgi:nicotinate-nucleotide pyrophosphorylase (carboxylating)